MWSVHNLRIGQWRSLRCPAAVWAVRPSRLPKRLLPHSQRERVCGVRESRLLHQVRPWHLFEFICKEGLAKPSHLNYCLSMFNLGRTLSHTSTGATSRLRWRTTTRMTSCCCALAVTRPQTCTTGSWSSGWPRSTLLRRAARRAFGCWRMLTAGGWDRPLGLSSVPATGCPSPGKRSSC